MHIVLRNTVSFTTPIMASTAPQLGSKSLPSDHYTTIIVIGLLLVLSLPAACIWHYCISPRLRRRNASNQEILTLPTGCRHGFRNVPISAPLPCNTRGEMDVAQGANESYEHTSERDQRMQGRQQLPQNSGQGRQFRHVDSLRDRYAVKLREMNANNSMRDLGPTYLQAEHPDVAETSHVHHPTCAEVGCYTNLSAFVTLPTFPSPEEFSSLEQDVVDSIPQPESSTADSKEVQRVGAMRPVQIRHNSFQAESNIVELDFVNPSESSSESGVVQDVGASKTMEMKRNSFQAVSQMAVIEEAPRNNVLSQVEMDFGQILRPSSARPVLRLRIPTAKELGLRDAVLVDPKDLGDLRQQSKPPVIRDAVSMAPKEVKGLRRQSKRQSLR